MQRTADQLLRQALEPLTDKCVAALATALAQNHPPDTVLIDINVRASDLATDFTPTWFRMDETTGQIGDPQYLMLSDRPIVDDDAVGDGSMQILAEWFADCWNRAGGATSAYPAYLCQHDDIESFDLRQRIWIDDEQKWPG
jgi:hypothetical protein